MEPAIKLKPRIGIDARPLSYGLTGNSRYLWETLKRLVHPDSLFEFVLLSNKDIHPIFLEDGKDLPLTIDTSQKSIGLYWLNFTLFDLLELHRIDLFWGTLQMLPIRKLKIPSVVNYHDLNFRSAPQTMTFANRIQHTLFSGFALENADRIFCLSKNTLQEITEYKPSTIDKCIVIYPGATPITKPARDTGVRDFFFTIGTVEPRKNLQTLLNSYLEIKKSNPYFPYRLVIAGRLGWGQKELSKTLRSQQFKDIGVDFIENPDEGQLRFLLENCEFFVFPSVHEGFGLPIIEAMKQNKACVCSDIPVFKEILEPPLDILVPPLDETSWKNAIVEMSNRPKENRQRNHKMSSWTWENTSLQLEKEFTTLWHNKVKESKLKNAIQLD